MTFLDALSMVGLLDRGRYSSASGLSPLIMAN
eukprot:CAMPEP_0114682096 /NCGR_PEP_ID=MMETSP0191-20121206/56125_1 /TAXON_ID=126664 /ORGANISM="Sorites sp." /LENGTH=31 /DNA_ID= /DNA_START= /DNA_END= /DNA_ORIENTATION=